MMLPGGSIQTAWEPWFPMLFFLGRDEMKEFHRQDPLLSLCGLACCLCPMEVGGYCPGCGGGPGNQPCAIARCSLTHGRAAYCSACEAYPCPLAGTEDAYDSFITHQNRLQNLEQAKGDLAGLHKELAEKGEILRDLLANHNDGRCKSLFCLGVNLLPLETLREIRTRLAENPERGSAARLLREAAAANGIALKLRKKK